MLQNKIYQNFLVEIFKTFFVILFGLSIIALTVRAVNFLDLIVDSGYPVVTYFKYSFLNLFGIGLKFIPFSFLLTITIFILKHLQESDLIILWTSGVKKIQLVNFFFLISIFVLFFYLIFSLFLTPLALNKSRQLLSNDNFNSFLPTIKTNQFSDNFKGFTFVVDKKENNKIQNIFLHDKSNNLKNLTSNAKNIDSTTIIAKSGIVEKRQLFLFNGQIISSKKDNSKNEVIKFEKLSVNLSSFQTGTIKKPKLQETSSIKLFQCQLFKTFKNENCSEDLKKEIIPTLNRRIITPMYIPVISLICSLLLIRTKKYYLNTASIFGYSFVLLLFTEIAVRYTGINQSISLLFLILPFILTIFFYFFLIIKFKNESKNL